MDMTFPDKNPYLTQLEQDSKNAETAEELEMVCSILEYVDSVQMEALLNDSSPELDNEAKAPTKEDILAAQNTEKTPQEILEELKAKYGGDES